MLTKSFLNSRTVWGILIMAFGKPALAQLGLELSSQDVQDLLDILITAAGGLLALYGRIKATKKIALSGAGGVATLCLVLAVGVATGCAGLGDEKERYQAWKDAKVAEAQAVKDVGVAQAENPSEVTLEPTTPEGEVSFKGKLTVRLAQGGGQQVKFADTPMPKSNVEVVADTVKAIPGEVGRTIIGVKVADAAERVLGKAFDKAGGTQTNVGNTTGDMNSDVKTGNSSPAGGNVTGPRDPTTTTTLGP